MAAPGPATIDAGMSVADSRVFLPASVEAEGPGCEGSHDGRARAAGAPRSLIVPKRSPQQRTGFSAEAFVDKAVSDAGHVWNDTRRDFGIDGYIEFVDAATQVSGHAVAAQVKGTAVGFPGETQAGSGSRARRTISITG
jgi:hypothetical protein